MEEADDLDPELRFGRMVVEQGLVKPEQVQECLKVIAELAGLGVEPLPRLGEMLFRKGYLTTTQVKDSLQSSSAIGVTQRAPVRAERSEAKTLVVPTKATLPEEAEAASKNPNNFVGKYVKVRLLGSGGMGDVWRAWDTELGRWVAIKFLKSEDPGELARFRREAQTAAKLTHPNIAAVYEANERFIVMQFVDGETLETYPRNDPRRLVAIVREAAHALGFAHAQGIIHRDLKPANIMVERESKPEAAALSDSRRAKASSLLGSGAGLRFGRVYVMDFGLSKGVNLDTSLSVSGTAIGTPSYMSPEQARASRTVDPRADVYALGATLYDLLTDRPPFNDENVYEVLRRVVETDPVPIRKLRPGVDADLETIVLKCLEKDPARRYDGVDDLSDDLGRWMDRQPIEAHAPSTLYRIRKFMGRHTAVLIPTLAALVVALACGAWVVGTILRKDLQVRTRLASAGRLEKEERWPEARDQYWSARESDPNNREAREGFARMEGRIRAEASRREEELARSLAREKAQAEALKLLESGRDALEKAAFYLYTKNATYEELSRLVGEGQMPIEAALAQAPWLATGHHFLGRAWDLRGEIDKAEAEWRKTIKLEAGFGPAHYELGRLLLVRAFLLVLGRAGGGDRKLPGAEAGRVADEAVREFEAAARAGFDDELQREIARTMVAYLRDKSKAKEIATAAIAKFGGRQGIEEIYELVGLCSVGDEALRAYDKAIEIRPNFAQALFNRGNVRAGLGRLDSALADWESVIRINPLFAWAYVNRGFVRHMKQDDDGALADYDEAIRLNQRIATAYNNRGISLRSKGRGDEAIADFNEAMRLDPLYSRPFYNRGLSRHLRGEDDLAIADYDEAIRLEPGIADFYIDRGVAKAARKNEEDALSDYDQALKMSPQTWRALNNRGNLYLNRNDLDRAFSDFDEAIRLNPKLAESYMGRALVHEQRSERDPAAADFAKALEVAPANWSFRTQVEAELARLKRDHRP